MNRKRARELFYGDPGLSGPLQPLAARALEILVSDRLLTRVAKTHSLDPKQLREKSTHSSRV